jgi:hypothetical protein
MWTPQRGQPVIILLLLILVPARVVGNDSPVMQRVRTDSPYVRVVIASGIERSPSFRAIVDQLERSDLIVEVQCTRLNDSRLVGRTVFLSAQPAVRYVLVEIECPAMLRIVAHELSHALEIATARSVVDSETLAQLYAQIGFPTYGPGAATCGQYETAGALDAGERVHHELLHPTEPTRRLARILTR